MPCSQRIRVGSGGGRIVQAVWNGHESVHWAHDLLAPGVPRVNENYASSNTRTRASPGAKGGVGISASSNTLFGSPVLRKINAFINTSWVFRRRLIPARMFYDFGNKKRSG